MLGTKSKVVIVIILLSTLGCNDTGFKGNKPQEKSVAPEGASQTGDALQNPVVKAVGGKNNSTEIASNEENQISNPSISDNTSADLPGSPEAKFESQDVAEPEVATDDKEVEPSSPRIEVPDNAAREGGFTVFTIPSKPQLLKPYEIVVLVTLPTGVNEYFAHDLSGSVHTYDGTTLQDLRDSCYLDRDTMDAPEVTRISGPLPIQSGQAVLRVWAIGGAFHNLEYITVRSHLLGEERNIDLPTYY